MEYYNKNRYANLPKKPVKTFHDLDVYQWALEGNVFVANVLAPSFYRSAAKVVRPSGKQGTKSQKKQGTGNSTSDNIGSGTYDIKETIIKTLLNCACGLPHLIAEAHSFRFGTQKECLILLEKAMLNCNKMVVYLDQARDICETGLEAVQFEELSKKYFLLRHKILNLQRSWKKYMLPAQD